MLKRRLTSIEDVQGMLDAILNSANSTSGLITILKGDDTVTGSIAKMVKDSKAYTDSKVLTVDLSQVAANQATITTLNGPISITEGVFPLPSSNNGSVKSKVEIAVRDHNDTEAAAILIEQNRLDATVVTLSEVNDDTVEYHVNSVTGKMVALIDGAPAMEDTLLELATHVTDNEAEHAGITQSIVDNLAAVQASLLVLTNLYDAEILSVDARFISDRALVDGKIVSESTIARTTADFRSFKVALDASETTNNVGATYLPIVVSGTTWTAQSVGSANDNNHLYKTTFPDGTSFVTSAITLDDGEISRAATVKFSNGHLTTDDTVEYVFEVVETAGDPIVYCRGALVDSEFNKSNARTNLAIIDAVSATGDIVDAQPEFWIEDVVVAGGVISVDVNLTTNLGRLKYLRQMFPNNHFDELEILPTGTPGEFLVQREVAGDLDGETVSIRYVGDQLVIV